MKIICSIEIRPKLIGSSVEVKIICSNANGYPSTKNNLKKVPEIKKLINNQNMAIILEMGINEKEKMLDLFEDINIAKENKMKSIDTNK